MQPTTHCRKEVTIWSLLKYWGEGGERWGGEGGTEEHLTLLQIPNSHSLVLKTTDSSVTETEIACFRWFSPSLYCHWPDNSNSSLLKWQSRLLWRAWESDLHLCDKHWKGLGSGQHFQAFKESWDRFGYTREKDQNRRRVVWELSQLHHSNCKEGRPGWHHTTSLVKNL